MRRLFTILVFSVVLLSLFLSPVVAEAVPCPFIINFSWFALPATDITDTTAVFNGQVNYTIQFPTGHQATEEEESLPLIFEYGTTPGVYTGSVPVVLVNEEIVIDDDAGRIIVTLRAPVSGLSPCTTYYVHLKLLDQFEPFPPPFDQCVTFSPGGEISFKTAGCTQYIGAGSHQSGGVNTLNLTNPSLVMSNIVVQSATIAATKISPGEKIDISASVVNKGGSNGTSKVTLYIDGQEAESKGITLSSGEATQVHFSVSRNDPGTYTVYVNGVSAGNFAVDPFTNNDILIYGIIALFAIGIVGVLYLVVKKRPL